MMPWFWCRCVVSFVRSHGVLKDIGAIRAFRSQVFLDTQDGAVSPNRSGDQSNRPSFRASDWVAHSGALIWPLRWILDGRNWSKHEPQWPHNDCLLVYYAVNGAVVSINQDDQNHPALWPTWPGRDHLFPPSWSTCQHSGLSLPCQTETGIFSPFLPGFLAVTLWHHWKWHPPTGGESFILKSGCRSGDNLVPTERDTGIPWMFSFGSRALKWSVMPCWICGKLNWELTSLPRRVVVDQKHHEKCVENVRFGRAWRSLRVQDSHFCVAMVAGLCTLFSESSVLFMQGTNWLVFSPQLLGWCICLLPAWAACRRPGCSEQLRYSWKYTPDTKHSTWK